ncbi:hypothetical protein [Streptomyces flaveolus]|uniref:hypothetical protein n=1 Tax=Streptomyces flaveolus TaxID=67297 RepID=UPI00380EB235
MGTGTVRGAEAHVMPRPAERYEKQLQGQVAAAPAIVRRDMKRDELSADISATFLPDALCDGAMNHAPTVPP